MQRGASSLRFNPGRYFRRNHPPTHPHLPQLKASLAALPCQAYCHSVGAFTFQRSAFPPIAASLPGPLPAAPSPSQPPARGSTRRGSQRGRAQCVSVFPWLRGMERSLSAQGRAAFIISSSPLRFAGSRRPPPPSPPPPPDCSSRSQGGGWTLERRLLLAFLLQGPPLQTAFARAELLKMLQIGSSFSSACLSPPLLSQRSRAGLVLVSPVLYIPMQRAKRRGLAPPLIPFPHSLFPPLRKWIVFPEQ